MPGCAGVPAARFKTLPGFIQGEEHGSGITKLVSMERVLHTLAISR